MTLNVSANLYSLLTPRGSVPTRVPSPVAAQPAYNLPATTEPAKTFEGSGTKLASETQEELQGGGIRRTQVFEREDGRTFTRVEDFSLTERGARRTVYQQNPSGTITQYEEVLDREAGGNFRRTQRFQDASGETSTQITSGYKVTDPFILTGGGVPASGSSASSPFAPMRGTQLDLSA